MTGQQQPTASDLLDRLIGYIDSLQDLANTREVPAYAETCPCGGSVEVAQGVPAAERRRVHVQFVGRHHACTKREASP